MRLSHDQILALREFLQSEPKCSAKEIAERYGITEIAVRNHACKIGVSLKQDRTPGLDQYILDNFEHRTLSEISATTGFPPSTVLFHARSLGITLKKAGRPGSRTLSEKLFQWPGEWQKMVLGCLSLFFVLLVQAQKVRVDSIYATGKDYVLFRGVTLGGDTLCVRHTFFYGQPRHHVRVGMIKKLRYENKDVPIKKRRSI